MSEGTEKTPRKGIVLQFPSKTQGKAMSFRKLEPWDDDVIGSELTEEIAATIRQYVVLTESATVAIKVDRLRSDAIASLLINLDERPWAEWKRGQPLSTYQLAYLLRSFSIRSSTIRVNSTAKPAKGYMRSQFEEAWAHYLTDETTAPHNNEVAS